MPSGRIKGAVGKLSVYHCMTRTVNGEFLFDDDAKELLRTQLWQAAEFSGVQILTYAILSNHFHVLVSVPDRSTAEPAVSDTELIRRYRLLHPKPTKFRPAQICVLEENLRAGGAEAARLRHSLLSRMHDISEFMKTVKQRFSVWFNRNHERYGTLWADRFRSTLVEAGSGNALLTVAAYIDLNPVRAGLVADPKDYRWSGYGEATGGAKRARAGLSLIQNGLEPHLAARNSAEWRTVAAEYRQLLYGKGAVPKEFAASIPEAKRAEVMRQRGELSRVAALRCRIRALTDGAVLGTRAFVLEQLAHYRERTGRRQHAGPQPLLTADHLDLVNLRGFRATG